MRMPFFAACAALLSLGGCITPEEQARQAQLAFAQDVATCQSFGAEYGSPAHYQCMLVQQARRDQFAAMQEAQTRALAAQAAYNIRMASMAHGGW